MLCDLTRLGDIYIIRKNWPRNSKKMVHLAASLHAEVGGWRNAIRGCDKGV